MALKKRTGPQGPVLACLLPCWSVPPDGHATARSLRGERGSTTTARLRLGVDEGEAARQALRHVVERRAVQIEVALGVAHHLHPVDVELLVVRPDLVVEL